MDDQLDDGHEDCDDEHNDEHADDDQGGGEHSAGAVWRPCLPGDGPVLQSSAGGFYMHMLVGLLMMLMTMIMITNPVL